VVALSGELSQTERTRALQAMRDHRAQVCVATDVAARGIDLPDLDLVIHADLPKTTEALLHRSGRTGRAGRKGASVLIVPFSARRRTERLLHDAKVSARWGEPPGADAIKQRDDARLLADPLLHAAPNGAEAEIVAELLSRFEATHIAAAFVRLARQGLASPEDIAPPPPWNESDGKARRERRADSGFKRGADHSGGGSFVGGAWVSLSVGRAQSAEPRWLIPMLCKAGGLTKRQLGQIRIQQAETHVEIDADCIDTFFERIGEGGRLEKSIRVCRLDAAPAGPGSGPGSSGRAAPRTKPPARQRAGAKHKHGAPKLRPAARGEKKGGRRPED
jgi:ATP-dependent RNA helicase DeaD